jgi:hypothetical protein
MLNFIDTKTTPYHSFKEVWQILNAPPQVVAEARTIKKRKSWVALYA